MPTSVISELAKNIRALSAEKWGTAREIRIIGRSSSILDAQRRLARFAKTDRSVLLTGESGTGKELFARSLYLLSTRLNKPFRSINCAQYLKGDLLVSELFGHRKGSFTGATKDRKGLFEAADGGTVFLDEVGELSPKAQAMLLRALSEGEIKPLGSAKAQRVSVRVVAATNRPLKKMVANGSFRKDLFYRLRYLHINLPPVRQRGDDWRLLARFFLRDLNRQNRMSKTLVPSAWSLLNEYHWPGNIREIRSIMDVGYCLSESQIEPAAFEHGLDLQKPPAEDDGKEMASPDSSPARLEMPEVSVTAKDCFEAMLREGRDFWETVRAPYLDRELNRAQVRAIVTRGLSESEGSYKRLLRIFGVEQDDYLKFMDFLRHHRLKPQKEAVAQLLSASESAAASRNQDYAPTSAGAFTSAG